MNMDETGLDDKPQILIVDDVPDNLKLASALLRDKYRVKVANNGARALAIAQGEDAPDLILLDVMMPEMDGYETCQRLKANSVSREIPVIFLTAKVEAEDEEKGLKLGAVDYIQKPFVPFVMLARCEAQLRLKASADFLRDQAEFLEKEVNRRTREISVFQDISIHAMVSMAETRDNETGNHLLRTKNYIRALALKLRDRPHFKAKLSEPYINLLVKSAPLHDIGKVGIPDAILRKNDRLTPEETRIMHTHPLLGYEAIVQAEEALESEVIFFSCAKEIIRHHHEKWDGSGYPDGLAGESIPLSARLMAIADVYDALVSKRVYKEGMNHEDSFALIREGRGKHFDPELVDAFLAIPDEIQAIARRWRD